MDLDGNREAPTSAVVLPDTAPVQAVRVAQLLLGGDIDPPASAGGDIDPAQLDHAADSPAEQPPPVLPGQLLGEAAEAASHCGRVPYLWAVLEGDFVGGTQALNLRTRCDQKQTLLWGGRRIYL